MSAGITLILGGSRSGKSRRAEALAAASGQPVSYVATCDTSRMDDEMRARVGQHRERRPEDWRTIEDRFDLVNVLDEQRGRLLLVDCLTLWLAWQRTKRRGEDETLSELDAVLQAASHRAPSVILVSNELGMGIVPASSETRGFRDLCGRSNQLAASRAARVEFIIAGLPLVLKGGE
jgi:adenosylcobinamide kinase/adenosylcobinamide-phosphate guanylyltransferase